MCLAEVLYLFENFRFLEWVSKKILYSVFIELVVVLFLAVIYICTLQISLFEPSNFL